MVRLDNIAKRYAPGSDALHDFSLSLAAGDFCFVTGAAGAGKTVLMNLIALAEPPSAGRLMLFGTDALQASPAARSLLRRRIGIVFQDLRLVDYLSVGENIGLPLRVAGVAEAEIRSQVDELCGWLGIRRRIDALPPALSPSERQQVAIARAVVNRPALLVADEPVDRADDAAAQLLMHLFEHLNSLGATVVIATRDVVLARRSGRIRLHLERGTLVNAENGAAA